LRAALFEPDIAANAAAAIRLCACLDVPLAIIEPCGFVWDERRLRRVGLDYLEQASLARFASWSAFEAARHATGERLVLLTTHAEHAYHLVRYRPDDVLLVGRESMGAPAMVHAAAALRVRVPMAPGRRSLNVVTALAIVLSEALRQTGGLAVRRPP
jgi:tRNA (cytidine/uridine-2'-O-)-methyltransferase